MIGSGSKTEGNQFMMCRKKTVSTEFRVVTNVMNEVIEVAKCVVALFT